MTQRTGTPGRGTNGISRATSRKRSAVNSRGGNDSRPTWSTTKFTPHVSATSTAMATWRRGMAQTVTAWTRKSEWTF